MSGGFILRSEGEPLSPRGSFSNGRGKTSVFATLREPPCLFFLSLLHPLLFASARESRNDDESLLKCFQADQSEYVPFHGRRGKPRRDAEKRLVTVCTRAQTRCAPSNSKCRILLKSLLSSSHSLFLVGPSTPTNSPVILDSSNEKFTRY